MLPEGNLMFERFGRCWEWMLQFVGLRRLLQEHGALGHPLARGMLPGSPGPPTSRRCNGYTLADSEYSNGENIMDFGNTWDSEAEFEHI